ncbi:1,4-dihydroxy-2-naphthoate polyprenyltransferase [Lactococcus hircilactis]|uniref:1,4-dihydroxy-2-naphthoate polyprenyltransferase n=1 Tax=Lactococcus hircilactis TaxID=1494462 RepID=A0A7X1Z7U7_9LACT|nr:prenyltransferase [Lactococcus hircilactis]MQW39448.1 1,4-dihydroxy-2-naphthoate polyprenyltransferase [Lactococcus hircilactis]
MNVKVFAELIELKAKTASVFPFFMGLAYSLYHGNKVTLLPLFLYFIAMFLFNCFVDIWDNYNDYHNAIDTQDYQKNTNIIGREKLEMRMIKGLLAFFFFSSLGIGLVVAAMTGWEVFFLGLICYAVGIFYAGGPKPLSTLPIGEGLSGLTMGYLIFLICVFISSSREFVWSFTTIGETFLVALPSVLLISNLMLANNTCDLAEDEANERYTIVHYIGKKAALYWWCGAIVLAYGAIFAAVILHLISPVMLALVFLIPLIIKLAKPYLNAQNKRTTFICSVKILMIFSLLQALLMYVGLLFNF